MTLRISRDGYVTYVQHLGEVRSDIAINGRERYFHNRLERAEQNAGMGYKSKRTAAEALLKLFTEECE